MEYYCEAKIMYLNLDRPRGVIPPNTPHQEQARIVYHLAKAIWPCWHYRGLSILANAERPTVAGWCKGRFRTPIHTLEALCELARSRSVYLRQLADELAGLIEKRKSEPKRPFGRAPETVTREPATGQFVVEKRERAL